jgi:hypothetical protein
MHRIDGPGHLANQFTEGDPQQGQAPTTVTDDWANAVQEEIAAVIEGAGIALVKGQQDQLLAALDARFAPLTPYTGHFAPIGSGTAVTAINTTVALTALDATHVVLVDETNGKLYLYSVDPGTGVFTLIGSGTAVTAVVFSVALTALDATHVVLGTVSGDKLFLHDAVVHKGRAAPWSAAGGAF